jgi:hypothetical protein
VIHPREFEDKHHGSYRHLHRRGQKRGRADNGKRANRGAGPETIPDSPQNAGQQCAVGQSRRQQAALGTRTQATPDNQQLEHQQGGGKIERSLIIEGYLRGPFAVAQKLGEPGG